VSVESGTRTQVWQKLGHVYCANGEAAWRRSHAYLPTAMVLSAATVRVFVAFLDASRMGRIGFVDVDAANPTRVRGVSARPCLDLGRPGTFDEHGVSPLCCIREGATLLLYYAGWQRSESVRYVLFTGLAKSSDDGVTFERISEAPVVDRCDGELLVRSGGFVFRHEDRWIMTYMGGSEQFDAAGKATPTYDMQTLSSSSPAVWKGPGTLALAPRRPDEFGFGRPWVIAEDGRFRMWLSVRSQSREYHLTYAESRDGLRWDRHDDVLRFVGADEDWDSRTRAIASVVDTAAGRLMFYNGNDYGATGFGVAKLVDAADAGAR
jgi:hypothetical protein